MMIIAAANIDLISVTIGLLGGLALFLFGMHEMSDGLKSAAGEGLKTLLEKLTSNRFMAATTGAAVTAIIQSSSVTTVLLIGFVNAGVMTLKQSVGVIMGANVGTTVTGQIAAFKVTEYSWLMIALGFAVMSLSKRGTSRHYGTMLFGLGMLFLGMDQMSQATEPLRSFQPFIDLMRQMNNPLLGIMLGAAFTALVQSSSATTGIVITLASAGFLSLEGGIALAIGANIGTCFTAMLATIGKPTVAVRTAVVHVIFNLLGALLWVGFISQLADFTRGFSPESHLQGIERLAAETPRQIANANTIFNIANTCILIWFVGPITQLAIRLVPDAKTAAPQRAVKPKYLESIYLKTPSLALDRVRMEIENLGEQTIEMVSLLPVVATGSDADLDQLVTRASDIGGLHSEILDYLRRLDVSELSDAETLQMRQALSATIHLTGAADLMAANFVGIGRQRIARRVSFSPTTIAELNPLYEQVLIAITTAVSAFSRHDECVAQDLIDRKQDVADLAETIMSHLVARLNSSDPDRVILFRLESETVAHLKWLFRNATEIAKSA